MEAKAAQKPFLVPCNQVCKPSQGLLPPRPSSFSTKSYTSPPPLAATLTPGQQETWARSPGGSQAGAALLLPAPRLSEAGWAQGKLSVSWSPCLPEPRWRVQALREGQGLWLQDRGAPLVRQEATGHRDTPQILCTPGPSKTCPLRS